MLGRGQAAPKADIAQSRLDVRFVPKADICSAAKEPRFDHPVGTRATLAVQTLVSLTEKWGNGSPPLPHAAPCIARCLLALDENLVTVRGTDVLSGVRGDDGHRKCGTGFAIGW